MGGTDRSHRSSGSSGPEVGGEDGEPSDVDLVASAQRGSDEAFGELVNRYQGRAFRLALRVMRDEEQARDVVQEAFLKAYRSLGRFEGRSSFYIWLYRLVMNLCIDAKRRDKSERHVEWEEERGVAPAPGAAVGDGAASAGPSEALSRSELRQQIAEAIATLPEDARRTFELREIDGLSYAEIAKTLAIPKGTVMSRLHYARKKLREALVEVGAAELEALT